MKAYAIAQLSEKMAQLQEAWYQVISNYEADYNNAISKFDEAEAQRIEQLGLRAGSTIMKEINKVSAAINTADKVFGGLQTNLNKYESNFTGLDFSGNGTGSNSNKGSGNKGSSSSNKETEKQVANLEDLTERYYNLENAVTKYSNALSLNKLMQDRLAGTNKIKAMKEEIELYEKQAQAVENLNNEYKKEAEEIKKALASNGFKFDADGNITNRNEEFARKVAKTNTMANQDQKEVYKNYVETMKEYVDRYTELVNNKIPDLNQEIAQLGNTAVEVQNKIFDMMDETLSKMLSKIDKEISNLEFKVDITGGTNATEKTALKASIIKLQKDKIKELNAALEELNKIVPTTEAQQESLNEKIEDTKNQITEAEQELRKLAGAYEEWGVELLYTPYRDKMWQTGTQQMNKVDLEMQTTEDTDTAKRAELMKQKLNLQKTMLEETRKYLQKLRNTTTTTTEGYQALIEKIKEAEEELYNQETAFNNLNKELEEFYKDKLNTVADVETEISNLIKKEAEKRIEQEKKVLEEALEADKKRLESKKKTLKEEQDLYNKQYETENYEAKLNEERNKLLQIQAEMDKLQFATDRASQEKLQSLMKEYSEQQQVINDMIRENQHEAINDRFEQEQEMIDQELEDKQEAYEQAVEELNQKLENFLTPDNLTNLVAAAINTGLVEVMGDTVELNDAMKQMLKESEVGVANLNIQFNNWLDKLAEIKDVTMDINKLMSSAGLNVSTDLSSVGSLASSRSVSIDMGGINIEGNVDKDVLSDIDKMLKKQQNDILNIMAKKLGGK